MCNRSEANRRFTIIADILPVLEDKKALGKAISRASAEYGISKPTVRRYLKLYQESGKEGLQPQKKNKFESDLKEHSGNGTSFSNDIRWGLNQFYYTTAKRSLKDAYRMLLEAKYYKEGKLADAFPTFWQFRYFYRQHNKKQNEIISRQGLSCYQRNERPLLGDVQQFASATGVGMLDSTICDIYLVNDAGQIVGRPILTACIDAYSGLCCGYSLGWEGGTYSLRNLMLNIIADKTAHCQQFGIKISKAEWDCISLPAKLITDMGSEYASENFSQLAELGITITNLPPYRPELKGQVEKFFDVVQNYYKPYLKGKGVIESDYRERGVADYRRQACLTLADFEKIIVHTIIFYNSKRLVRNFPYTDEMLDADVKPYASDIWNWGCGLQGSNLLDIDRETLILTLLPRTTARFTRKGLIVNKLRYTNPDFTESYLSGQEAIVSYCIDDVSKVFLLENGRYIPFILIESRYESKSFQEVTAMEQKKKELLRSQDKVNLLAEVELASHIKSIAETAKRVNRTDITDSRQAILNIRKTRKKEESRNHINLMEGEAYAR